MIYLKCGNPNGCYNDPSIRFFLKGGQVKGVESLTETMKKWIREGGLVKVDQPAESPGDAGVATPPVGGVGPTPGVDIDVKPVGKLEAKIDVKINPKLKP